MTRTLFFFTCLAAMLMTVCAVLIRVELAYPGVSPLFSTLDGAADGAKFTAVATSHAVFGYLAVMLLGTTMISAARSKGAPLGGVMVGLGIVLSLATASLFALTYVPAAPVDQTGVGWVLYPPLSTPPTSMLDQLAGLIDISPVFYADLTRLLILPAGALIYLGAYAMLSTEPGLRWMGPVGLILSVIVTLIAAPNVLSYSPNAAQITFFALSLPFLAGAAIRIVDGAEGWLVLLALGVIASMVAEIVLVLTAPESALSGTMAGIVALYVYPMGLAWLALPALIIFAGQRSTPWPTWVPWALAVVIFAELATWLAPMFTAGLDGQPYGYMDYTDAYATDNLLITSAVAQFILIYLAMLTLLRRNAR